MIVSLGPALFWLVVAIQVIGLLSVAGARLSEYSSAQAFLQRVCFASFLTIGAAAMLAIICGTGYWLPLGATLAGMSVGATFDAQFSTSVQG